MYNVTNNKNKTDQIHITQTKTCGVFIKYIVNALKYSFYRIH